jgi:hypothetical protein
MRRSGMGLARRTRAFLLALPALLTASTALSLTLLARWLGDDLAASYGSSFRDMSVQNH